MRQDENGASYIDSSNGGFNFSVVENTSFELLDVLPAYSYPSASEVQPLQSLAEGFVEQLDATGTLSGQTPLFGVRLTAVKNGSVLGVSMLHAVAGMPL